jgi:uncharacterized damage-inducible protein DinB
MMRAEWVITKWGQIRDGLRDTMDKFSEDELSYRPFERGYSVREIMLHIAQEELGEIQYGITAELDAFPEAFEAADYPSIESVTAVLNDVHQRTLEYLDQLEEEDLESEVEAGWGGKYLLADMIWHVMEHEIHHRGELSFILGLLGREGLDA